MANVDRGVDKKLMHFEESIEKRVEKKCASIQKELETYRAQELSKYYSSIETDTKDIIST